MSIENVLIFDVCDYRIATSKTDRNFLSLVLEAESDPLVKVINAGFKAFAKEAMTKGWNPYEQRLGDYVEIHTNSDPNDKTDKALIKALNEWSEAFARDKESPLIIFTVKETGELWRSPDYVLDQTVKDETTRKLAEEIAKQWW